MQRWINITMKPPVRARMATLGALGFDPITVGAVVTGGAAVIGQAAQAAAPMAQSWWDSYTGKTALASTQNYIAMQAMADAQAADSKRTTWLIGGGIAAVAVLGIAYLALK